MRVRGFMCFFFAVSLCSSMARAQQNDGTDVAVNAHVWKPAKVAADDARIAQLRVPPGFGVTVFARDLKNARVLVTGSSGNVYLSRREEGDVLLLKDTDQDGVVDGKPITVTRRAGTHGLAVHAGKLYVVTVKEIFVGEIMPDGSVASLRMLLGDLPDAGQHPNRTLAFGPDGMLYVSVGSTCNACNESNPESATLLEVTADGKSRKIFASGLRNTIGFDWHPVTGELWGFDHGIDFLGDDEQPEELNRIARGKQYGWPHVYGKGEIYPQSTPPGGISKEQWRARSEPMALGYTAHAAPMQMLFYRGGSFPREYVGDAFVSFRGSWNRKPASGYEVARVRFDERGGVRAIEPFLSGFLSDDGRSHFARPMGLAVADDGALLVADDANGVIYRVVYQGPAAASADTSPATPAPPQASKDAAMPLALQRPEMQGRAVIKVRSPTIAKAIPNLHSDYADGVSPEITWDAVPGARSYVLIVEDPDATSVKPFVHWLAWNIPAHMTTLPAGLQKQARLTEPPGVLQGRTSRGSVGYFGPRPPAGDPPHHYHFQVFALDTEVASPAGAERDEVLAAMKGHVLAAGELIGTYQQTVQPLK